MKSSIIIKQSEYLQPKVQIIDLKTELVLCTSKIEYQLPSWTEDDVEVQW